MERVSIYEVCRLHNDDWFINQANHAERTQFRVSKHAYRFQDGYLFVSSNTWRDDPQRMYWIEHCHADGFISLYSLDHNGHSFKTEKAATQRIIEIIGEQNESNSESREGTQFSP